MVCSKTRASIVNDGEVYAPQQTKELHKEAFNGVELEAESDLLANAAQSFVIKSKMGTRENTSRYSALSSKEASRAMNETTNALKTVLLRIERAGKAISFSAYKRDPKEAVAGDVQSLKTVKFSKVFCSSH